MCQPQQKPSRGPQVTEKSALRCTAERRDARPEMLHVTQAAPSLGQRVDEQPLG